MHRWLLEILGGLVLVGAILFYEAWRSLSVVVMLETTVVVLAAFLGICQLLSYWRNR